MYWKLAKRLSITTRLLLLFISATLLILGVITVLVYPPMRALLHQSSVNHEHYNYLLTQMCIQHFFIGLWISALIVIVVSYWLAKKSMNPIKHFSTELASIKASSLDKRLKDEGHPKELQELASTCNDMLSRIEGSFAHIKQFSASIAHELRNPLHYLQTATEVTLSKPQTTEAYQQLLQNHMEEYQNLTKLIDKLLFLTRSEHGQIPLNKKRVSANRLIHSIVDYFSAMALENKITIEVLGEATIEVDEQLFKRIIANVIDNSLAYTQEGGTLAISIEQSAKGQVKIILKDNGMGIDKEHLSLICQGFYRIDPNTNNKNVGLGLGLAIAKSIMENHKGQLQIESQPQQGTTVTLVL